MGLLEHDVAAGDGRNLRVREAADRSGFPVFVHHGTPMAGCIYEPWAADASERGLRLLTHDRPGYGGSTPHPGRTISDVARDVEAIADALGIERFATWGTSGGGPHALACGALLGDRVTAVGTFAGVGPYGSAGLDFLAGMGEDNVTEFGKAVEGREQLEPLLEAWRPMILAAGPDEVLAGLESLVSDADKAVLGEGLASFFHDCDRIALGDGIEGWVEDDLAFVAPWGFELSDVKRPVLLWQGQQDLMVPFEHGRWMTEQLPNVEARLVPEEGHLTLLQNRVPEMHAWLKDRS